MHKLLIAPILLLAACITAGVYGALHNQISYTVAEEYCTKFKFAQFRISDDLPHRLGAAIVGWKASWWMGLIIEFFLIPLGLIIPGTKNYFTGMLKVFGIVALTALCIGMVGLAISYWLVDPQQVDEFTRYGNEIEDDAAFARAGSMHNFSYLGGFVGMLTGAIAIFYQRRRIRTSLDQVAEQPDR